MTNEITNKKYPSRCIACGKRCVQPTTLRHELDKNHDGRTYHLVSDRLPADQCEACGEIYFSNACDDAISAALRAKLGLLTPEQIRSNIQALGLQQKQVAECLGMASETLSRWINGSMIQSRAMDNLLRVYFGSPEAREKLLGEKRDPSFGASVEHELYRRLTPL